jgi:hypothetical protein
VLEVPELSENHANETLENYNIFCMSFVFEINVQNENTYQMSNVISHLFMKHFRLRVLYQTPSVVEFTWFYIRFFP